MGNETVHAPGADGSLEDRRGAQPSNLPRVSHNFHDGFYGLNIQSDFLSGGIAGDILSIQLRV